MSENNDLTIKQEAAPVKVTDMYADMTTFRNVSKMANMLSQSQMVPSNYQGNLSNCMIAIELAARMKSSPFMVMQNLDIIKGRPSFSSKFIIAMINQSPEFSRLKFEFKGEGKTRSCVASAIELSTGDALVGPTITWKMAEAEGWTSKAGSKWQTMPDVMFQYRAASFWARMYVPDMLMGMYTTDEVIEMDIDLSQVPVVDNVVENVDKEVETEQATQTLDVKPDPKQEPEPENQEQLELDDEFPEILK